MLSEYNQSRWKHVPLAQLVEQLTLNQWVRGSSPRWRTNHSFGAGLRLGSVASTIARVAELVDAIDLGSIGCSPCGFESLLAHQKVSRGTGCGSSSAVEHCLAKARVESSNLFFRSSIT